MRLRHLAPALVLCLAAVWMCQTPSQTIRIASVSAPSHHHNQALKWFAERVNRRDIGLRIRVLSGGQLGKSERAYIEGMEQDQIQIAQVSTGPLAGFIGEFDLFSLPYLFRDTRHLRRVVGGPIGRRFLDLLQDKGMKGLCWFDNGDRNIFNNIRPIVTPEDLKGLKIRVMKSRLMVDAVNAMGGSAAPMAYGELYTALQQGVLDGGENAAGNVLNGKLFEVSRYYSLTRHFRPPGLVAMSLKLWRRLSSQQQAVLMEEAAALQEYEIDLTTRIVAAALDQLQARGMKINQADVAAFAARVRPVYSSFTDRYGSDLIEAVRATR